MSDNWLFEVTKTIQSVRPGWAVAFQMGDDNKIAKLGAAPTTKWVDDNPDEKFQIYSVPCAGTDKNSVMDALPRLIDAIKSGVKAA